MERDDGTSAGAAGATPPLAIALDNDIFFAVKVADTLRHAGYETRTIRTLDAFIAALTDRQVVALVNTAARGVDWRAAIAAARDAGIPVIAFGPHVDLVAQEEARRAGAAAVISNSKLANDLPGVVARTLHRKDLDAAKTQPDDAGMARGTS
jgi:DNA-binding NtrC family response regulator